MLTRFLGRFLPDSAPPRRIVVLTGARQVGKTTLARHLYESTYRYLNLDSPGERARLSSVPAEAWDQQVGEAVLDEVQKGPGLLDKLKWAYDEGRIDFSVLLGSSRLLLLEQVKESLAGRIFLYDLWPLTTGELSPHFGGHLPEPPLLVSLLAEHSCLASDLEPLTQGIVGPEVGAAQAAMEHVLRWGGLAALLAYEPEDRLDWLEAYQASYLERDLRDLARLRDLEAFSKCHRLAAARAGRLLSFSELARDASLPVSNVRRYLRYLELSYQILQLPAWSGNPSVRLIKSPKLLWFDAGVQRILSGQTGGLTGEQYESFLIGQILTTLWSHRARFQATYLRTAGGLEVDLLLERPEGILALEFKRRDRVDRRDAGSIERARRILGDRFLGGMVIYRGAEVGQLTESVWAVPDWMLLGWVNL